MKPGWKHPSTSKKHSCSSIQKLSHNGGIHKKSHSSKHKHQHRNALKKYWKSESKPLAAQVHHNGYSQEKPPKCKFFQRDDLESSSEESSSEDTYDGAVGRITENERSVNDEEYESNSDIGDESEVEENKIKIFMLQNSGFFLVVVDHPMTFSINGTVSIRVISGTANVLGYELDVKKDFVPIYSASNIFHVCVETTSSIKKDLYHWNSLEMELNNIADKEQVSCLQSMIKDTSVLMILRKNPHANFVEFAQSYIPSALPLRTSQIPNSDQMANLGFTISGVDKSSVRPSEALHSAAEMVKFDIDSFIMNRVTTKTPRILIYGHRGLGKSTSLRFLINKVLSSGFAQKIFCLDIDPGQSEFTLPCCVSLTEIQEPLLGPNYTHLQTPKLCKFFGGLTVDGVNNYFDSLEDIMNYYKSNFSDDVLFINTLGWIKDLGLQALEMVRETLKPTIEIELFRADESKLFDFNACNIHKSGYPRKLRIPSNIQKSIATVIPAARRSISILSYFGKLIRSGETYRSFQSFKPYCISATNFAIHVIHGEILEFNLLINAINASIVALCIVEESEIINCIDDIESRRLVPESQYGKCIGFGFIKAIDFVKKLLYIITPVELMELRKVNALIKGDLKIPDEVHLKQAFSEDTPYIKVSDKNNSTFEKKVRRRIFRGKKIAINDVMLP